MRTFSILFTLSAALASAAVLAAPSEEAAAAWLEESVPFSVKKEKAVEDDGVCEVPKVCTPTNCKISDGCFCSGALPDLPADDRPQFLTLTFDDAIVERFDRQIKALQQFNNPDGSRVRFTFFASHKYTDYSLAHQYYEDGHELASHSVTHRDSEEYWRDLNVTQWEAEYGGMRRMLARFAKVPIDDIVGVRAPKLRASGDVHFRGMKEAGFKYDSSRPSSEFGGVHLESGLWPYTMDHASVQDCLIRPCPECAHKGGLWTQPMLSLEDSFHVAGHENNVCPMLDMCRISETGTYDEADVYMLLVRNFKRVYDGNRAPLGFYVHAAWFLRNEKHFHALLRFIAVVLKLHNDVFVVSMKEVVEYMEAGPVTANELTQRYKDNPPMAKIKKTKCHKRTCMRDFQGSRLNFVTCTSGCPRNYPWLHNEEGRRKNVA